MISYRLKNKELVFLLDLFGDVNSLPQSFGNIFIDRDEYRLTADGLHEKGFVTVCGDTVSADLATEMLFCRIFDADVVFTDKTTDIWCYCCEDMIVLIRDDTVRHGEYLVTPFEDTDELAEFLCDEGFSDNYFMLIRPYRRKIDYDGVLSILRGRCC